MATKSRRQSYPVLNSADLERAIQAAGPQDHAYVMGRARALGRMDLIPPSWQQTPQRVAAARGASLDAQFEEYARTMGVSSAKLKAVYLRGVAEYNESSSDFGNAVVWGMARVQRFMDGACDEDLMSQEAPAVLADCGIELSQGSGVIIADVLYGDGSAIARIFHPGEVLQVQLEDHMLYIMGNLDEKTWRYALDCSSGVHSLLFA